MKGLLRAIAAAALTVCTMAVSAAQEQRIMPEQRTGPERRVALLIGTENYPGVRGLDLANVGRDLVLLEDAFRRAGFETQTAKDLTRASLLATLRDFNAKARDADVAIVYFTGLGVEVGGVNYYGPVDFDEQVIRPNMPEALAQNVLDSAMARVTSFIDAVQPARRLSMVMADGGRVNPFVRSTRGIARAGLADIARDSDTLVLYASESESSSQDGPPGGTGPFATAVAKHLATPNLEIGLFVRRVRADVRQTTNDSQRPILYGQLSDREFYFVGGPPPAPAPLILSDQPRLALVIGNSDYNGDGDLNDDKYSAAVRELGFAPDLPNPANDARDMKAALEKLKFSVDLVENADNLTLGTKLIEFEEKVVAAGEDAIVVIYYAGHAIQVGGANFLVPVGGKLPAVDLDRLNSQQAELVLTSYAMPLQTALLGRLKEPSRRGLNLVILDACRENPWDRRSVGGARARNVGAGGGTSGRSRGLGDVQIDLRRTAIAYATKPGDVADDGAGRNSPYTAAFTSVLEEPGISVIELLDRVGEKVQTTTNGTQVPWNSNPSLGRTCLGLCAVQ